MQKLTECLCDGSKLPLFHDPALAEVDLCYKAIPHYKSFVTKRETLVNRRIKEGKEAEKKNQEKEKEKQKKKREQIEREIPHQNRKFLKGDNQPIPVKNEHEFAHLYLEEIYNILPSCNILELNMDARLTILSKASCFSGDLRKQALLVKGVRNKWLCSNLDY